MNKEQLLKKLEYLLKPLLEKSHDINYGRLPHIYGKKEGIEFIYKDDDGERHYVRVEIK